MASRKYRVLITNLTGLAWFDAMKKRLLDRGVSSFKRDLVTDLSDRFMGEAGMRKVAGQIATSDHEWRMAYDSRDLTLDGDPIEPEDLAAELFSMLEGMTYPDEVLKP